MSAPLFAVYDTATGALVSTGSVVANPLPAGLAVLDISAVDMAASVWDDATRTMIPTPTRTVTEMSRGDWMARLGTAREVMLNELRLDPAIPLSIRAQIDTLYAKMARRAAVDVAFPETVEGVNALATLLVFAKSTLNRVEGLDASEVPAFVSTMLAPAVVPHV